MKKYCVISNIVLLCWYFLSMTGVYFGNKYLVARSYKEEWIFMMISLLAFILFILKDNVGKIVLIVWLSMWFATQFLSHEWYSIFGSGFMGSVEGKIEYFADAIKLFDSKAVYIPDVYHIILHLLILVSLVTTIVYSVSSRDKR